MTNITDPQAFNRNKIKSRLLKKAAEMWGYQEWEMDSFDPLVTLLIEACSVEFEKLYTEINTTQNRIQDRLSHVLIPDVVDNVYPACGIMQAKSVEPTTTIAKETQFYLKKTQFTNVGNNVKSPYDEFFFTPLQTTLLFDGCVKYLSTREILWSVENGFRKNLITTKQNNNPVTHHSFWIALELNPKINTLKQLSFYFDWFNEPDKEWFREYLPFGKWFLGEQALNVKGGFSGNEKTKLEISVFEDAFDGVKKIEGNIRGLFNKHFITIQDEELNPQLKKIHYPAIFETLFDKAVLNTFREPLVWIEIRFPLSLPAVALNNVHCSINAFPVLNRKLNTLMYKLIPSVNCIPLTSDEPFLGIKQVQNSFNKHLKPVPLATLDELEVETYTLRYYGANRFDKKEAKEKITELMEMIRDEYASFAAVGQDFLQSVLIDINQHMSKLEQKLNQEAKALSPAPYLLVKTDHKNDILYIDYWTSQGIAANKITNGTRCGVYNNLDIREGENYLITTTFGGKERLSSNEKLNLFKKSLLSRGKIVTHEDIKIACYAEIGNKLHNVTITKGIEAGRTPAAGFFRSIVVTLIPNYLIAYDELEWIQICALLKENLERNSTGNLPFVLKVKLANV